jgi:hypothetical protein
MPYISSEHPVRLSGSVFSPETTPGEREMVEQLQAALAPSYVLVKRLGAGGMGTVYLARDPALRRLVAVKVLAPERAVDPEARSRFQREAQAVAAIAHPNVVAVYSVGELPNGSPYLVMQYVEGCAMSERLRNEGPLDLESAKRIIGEVASALAATHLKGIIHRDIKAANILWDDAAARALVSDFGIAAVLEKTGPDDPDASKITLSGMAVGTPAYMSPEQLVTDNVTEKTDIYSLGLLGYELLTGEGPYRVSSPREMIAAHLRDVPRPVSSLRSDVDPEFEALLIACLAKEPENRPTADQVSHRVAHGAGVLLEWPPPGLERLQGALRRPRRFLIAGALTIGIPLVISTAFDRGTFLRVSLPDTLLLPSIAAVGLLAFILGCAQLSRVLTRATRAAHAGYGWGTVAEVLVDDRRDGGALIAGAREYAALTPEARGTIRKRRLVGGALRITAAPAPVVGYFVGLPIAARLFGSPEWLLVVSLIVPLFALVAAGLLDWSEDRMLREARARFRVTRPGTDTLSQIVASWRETLLHLTQGQRAGEGPTGRTVGVVATTGFAIVASFVAVLVAYVFLSAGVLAEISARLAVPRFLTTQERANRIARIREYRPPIDSTITPLRAGEAMHALASIGSRPSLASFERAPARPIADTGITIDTRPGPFRELKGSWIPGAIGVARNGLTPEQRRFLEAAAHQPGLDEYALLSRSLYADFYAAALVSPLPPEVTWAETPTPRFAVLRNLANARVAQAALDVADRKIADAEAHLREPIGVGFLLMERPTVIENLVGIFMVGVGRSGLAELYAASGREAEGRRISAEADPIREGSRAEFDALRMDAAERTAYMTGIVRDTTRLRGIRWELTLGSLAYEPCGDIRQLVFGPDSLHLARMEEARQVLVRSPGDSLLFLLTYRALETPIQSQAGGVGPDVVRGFTRTVDALVGGRRFTSCASLILGRSP